VSLTGKVNPVKGAVTVDLWARPYPEPASAKVVTTTTQGGGNYAFALPPQLRTEYLVPFVDGAAKADGPVVAVLVRPEVTLAVKSVAGVKTQLRTGVVSTVSCEGKRVLAQSRNSQGGWTTIRTVKLGRFSSSTFAGRCRRAPRAGASTCRPRRPVAATSPASARRVASSGSRQARGFGE
jgi:hypothetical protein